MLGELKPREKAQGMYSVPDEIQEKEKFHPISAQSFLLCLSNWKSVAAEESKLLMMLTSRKSWPARFCSLRLSGFAVLLDQRWDVDWRTLDTILCNNRGKKQ